MQLLDFSPKLTQAYRFDFNNEKSYKRLYSKKTQSCFRLIYLQKGSITMVINGNKHHLSAGSVIYMPPYTTYNFTKVDNSFSIVNILFNVGNEQSSDSLIYLSNNYNLPTTTPILSNDRLNSYIVDFQPELEHVFTKLLISSAKNTFIETTTIP